MREETAAPLSRPMTDAQIDELAAVVARQAGEQVRLQATFDRDKASMIERHRAEREALERSHAATPAAGE